MKPPRKALVIAAAPILLIFAVAVANAAMSEDPTPTACLQSSVICSGLDVPGDEVVTEEPTGTDETIDDSDYEPPTCTAWDGTVGPETYELVSEPDQSDWKAESPRFEEDGVTPQEGNWYHVFCGGSRTTNVWVPTATGGASSAPQPPPAPTAAEVRNQTPIGDAEIVVDPNELGLTGLLTRFTTRGVEPVSSTSSIRGYSITATATPQSYSWSFDANQGDSGSEVTHVFQMKGTKTITLTVTYSGHYEWSGNGRSGSGDLGSVQHETTRDYHVIEARGVLTAIQ